ncbi:MAG: hypothetical protein EVB11_11480 [Winogradskyella sp.]|nr:MAG: hypothetical protein EVB11_11480 [Winogradskyella sp.]
MRKYIVLLLFTISIMSCEDIIETEDISQEQVTILAPTNNAILNLSQIRFTWQSVADADNYKLQIATPNFIEAIQILEDTLVATTEFDKNLDTGNYEWRVKALNSAYETTYTSQNFTVEN